MSLPVKWQEQSYCNCLCIRASQMITLLLFCKSYVSTVHLKEYFKNSYIGQTETLVKQKHVIFPDYTHLLFLVKQKFDRLLFLCIICHGIFPVLWCLIHQVFDQKYFAAPKELNKLSLVTMLTLDGFGRQSETISVTP